MATDHAISTPAMVGSLSLPRPLPPLETGDRLTRPEFERRYEAMPNCKKAELINGVVYVGSPVSHRHGLCENHAAFWLTSYAAQTPGFECFNNTSVLLDLDNEVQPDIALRSTSSGRSSLTARGYVEGPPELIVEIASSSVSRDLHDKLALYRRHGVSEYLVWRVLDNDFDWFHLVDGDYQRVTAGDDGVVRSPELRGLGLDVAALLRGDLAAVLAALQRAIAETSNASPPTTS